MPNNDRPLAQVAFAFSGGALIGILGGLVGLGGAEFRLPLLLMFGFSALPAVIVNKAISLLVVSAALVFRSAAVAPGELVVQWPVIVNLLAGSLVGSLAGRGLGHPMARGGVAARDRGAAGGHRRRSAARL